MWCRSQRPWLREERGRSWGGTCVHVWDPNHAEKRGQEREGRVSPGWPCGWWLRTEVKAKGLTSLKTSESWLAPGLTQPSRCWGEMESCLQTTSGDLGRSGSESGLQMSAHADSFLRNYCTSTNESVRRWPVQEVYPLISSDKSRIKKMGPVIRIDYI